MKKVFIKFTEEHSCRSAILIKLNLDQKKLRIYTPHLNSVFTQCTSGRLFLIPIL